MRALGPYVFGAAAGVALLAGLGAVDEKNWMAASVAALVLLICSKVAP